MDDDDPFTIHPDQGTNVIQVAVHEIGHVLGLSHVLRNYSVMYAIYSQVRGELELDYEDRRLVQGLYGHCSGRFNTVFDLITWRADGTLAYTTFFFRGDHYWMYQNSRNRSRPGDPLLIKVGWTGLPDTVDAFAHIWTQTKDAHIFFKGIYYYLYDPVEEKVVEGYPRKIARDFRSPKTYKSRRRNRNRRSASSSDGFVQSFLSENNRNHDRRSTSSSTKQSHTPDRQFLSSNDLQHRKQRSVSSASNRRRTRHRNRSGSSTHHLPTNIDAAYFDKRDENLYVFKNGLVYGYNVSAGGEGCCLPGYPRSLQQEFTAIDDQTRPLPNRLDAVYYSYHHKTLLIIKGRHYWKVVSYHPLDQHRTNLIRGPSLVRRRWPDICDTDLHIKLKKHKTS
uniref:Matrix metalloproteinase-14-like n=2 Tax=Hirondellea gigas TaxID=1518452 RepID=A0A6A7G9L7_9CRUS